MKRWNQSILKQSQTKDVAPIASLLVPEDGDGGVTIVILNHNGLSYLQGCFRSLLSTTYNNFDVVFIDNASSDASMEFVKEHFGADRRLRILSSEENLGYAKGNNLGARLTTSEYLVFLNNDTEVHPNWLSEIIETMKSDASIAACQPKLLLMGDRKRLDMLGSYMTRYGFLYHLGHLEEDWAGPDPFEIFSAKGACIAVRTLVFRKVGGFDESYFIYNEETDLCWRIWLSGFRVLCVPKAVVFHEGGGDTYKRSSGSLSITWIKQGAFYGFRNRILSLAANLGPRNLLTIIPIHIVLCLGIIVWLGLNRRTTESRSVAKALLWSVKNVQLILVKRWQVQRKVRRLPDSSFLPKVTKRIHIVHMYRILGNYLALVRSQHPTD